MRKIVLTAMLAALWMGYNDKHKPKVEPPIIEAVDTSDDKLYNTAALFIKSEESLKLKPYKCPGGKWTIGWGHVMTKSEHRKERNVVYIVMAFQLSKQMNYLIRIMLNSLKTLNVVSQN